MTIVTNWDYGLVFKSEHGICFHMPCNCKFQCETALGINRNTHNVLVNTNSAEMSTAVEPDLLGPCDPGTAINLDGIVWLETGTGE